MNGVPVITDKMVLAPTQGHPEDDGAAIVLQDVMPRSPPGAKVILARPDQG